MLNSLEELKETLKENEDKLIGQHDELRQIFIWLSKYIKNITRSDEKDKRGEELRDSIENTINIAIRMLSMIDKGDTGLDDKLAEDFKKLKVKYLGL